MDRARLRAICYPPSSSFLRVCSLRLRVSAVALRPPAHGIHPPRTFPYNRSMTQTSGPWTVRRLLEWTSGFFARKEVDAPRLAAELLLAHVLKVPRLKLYTDYERPLAERELTAFRAFVQRAGEHEPIAYLTGRAHFFNLEFEVTPAVLIPRPDTETLVENVLQLARNTAGFESPRVLEDRKSTRLNSSHLVISYAVFCLKKKNRTNITTN